MAISATRYIGFQLIGFSVTASLWELHHHVHLIQYEIGWVIGSLFARAIRPPSTRTIFR